MAIGARTELVRFKIDFTKEYGESKEGPWLTGLAIAPDWRLGALFGFGGFWGMYCGARMQKYFPTKIIKLILGLIILFLSSTYMMSYFQ